MRVTRRSAPIVTGTVFALALAVGAGGAALLTAPRPASLPAAASPLASGAPTTTAQPSSTTAQPSSTARRTGRGAPPANLAAWTLPAGWTYEMDCEDGPCRLHRTGPDGSEAAGWPVRLGGSCSYDVAVGPDERVFVACDRARDAEVSGLDKAGAVLPGWPVWISGQVAWSTWHDFAWGGGSSLAVSPDRTVYVAVTNPRYAIHGLTQAGEPRPGWPRELQGGGQGFVTASDGAVVAWWFEGLVEEIGLAARRTLFTVLDADGDTLPGWPIGSKGAASGPVATEDGRLFYTSATGKVYGHDRSGYVIGGWPYQLDGPVAPQLRSDGTLLFIGLGQIVVLDTRGRLVPGWPYRAKGSLDGPGCDTPSFGYSVVARGPEDSLYLAERGDAVTRIVRLDRDGAVADGWPFRLPPGWVVSWLVPEASGEVTVRMAPGWCSEEGPWLRLSGDGQEVSGQLPTPLEVVYEALRLTTIETEAGRTSYQAAEGIVFRLGLVNESRDPVILMPSVDDDGGGAGDGPYAAGSIVAWIERLGPDPSLAMCMPDAEHLGTWYRVAGWDMRSQEPVRLDPGESMWTPLRASLPSSSTWCLPPGAYRFHAQYLRLDSFVDEESGQVEGVIDHRALDLTITPTRPTPLPTMPPGPSMTPPAPSAPPTPGTMPPSLLPSPSPSSSPSGEPFPS